MNKIRKSKKSSENWDIPITINDIELSSHCQETKDLIDKASKNGVVNVNMEGLFSLDTELEKRDKATRTETAKKIFKELNYLVSVLKRRYVKLPKKISVFISDYEESKKKFLGLESKIKDVSKEVKK